MANPSNPKEAFGDKKVPLHLCPPAASAYMAVGLREGAMKYGAWNFREIPIELMTYIGAIKRHCDALLEGEWTDPDPIIHPDGHEITEIPKKSHLAGILASAAILADSYENGNVVDNRPEANKGYSKLMESLKKNERVENSIDTRFAGVGQDYLGASGYRIEPGLYRIESGRAPTDARGPLTLQEIQKMEGKGSDPDAPRKSLGCVT